MGRTTRQYHLIQQCLLAVLWSLLCAHSLTAAPLSPGIKAMHVEFTPVSERVLPNNDRFRELDNATLFFEPDLSDAYWIRMSLPNNRKFEPGYILSIRPASIHNVDMYIPALQGNEPIKSINRFKIDTTPKFSNRTKVFEIPDNYKVGQDILFYVHSRNDEQLKIDYWTHDQYLVIDRKQSIILSAMLASLFILVIVNLIFYAAIRDRDLLSYVVYLGAILLFTMMASGKLYEFESGRLLAGSYNSTLLLFTLTCITLTIFIQRFLKLKTYTPVFYIVTNICLLVYVGVALFSLVFWPAPPAAFNVVNYAILMTFPLGLYAALKAWYLGHKQAAYFLLAFTPLIFTVVIRLMVILDFIPDLEIANYGFYVAVVFQGIVLTIGLSDQMLRLRNERDVAQRESDFAAQSLQEQQDFSNFLARVSAEVRANPGSNHDEMIVQVFFDRIQRLFQVKQGAVVFQVDADIKVYANHKRNQSAFEEYVNDHIEDVSKICHGTEINELTLFSHPFFPVQTKMLILPVHMRGHEWSGMLLNIEVTSKITSDEFESLHRYATELVRTLVNAHKLKQYSIKAETDDLTQVMNRGAILNQLNNEIDNAMVSHLPLSIAFVDIDHFKEINDSLGHEAGDTCLSYLSYQMKRYMPKDCHVGRLGGDEFLFVCPNYTPQQVRSIMISLSGSLDTLIIEDDECQFTLSIGIAQYEYPTLDFKSLLRRADSALYQSKNNGRDCITIDDPTVMTPFAYQPGANSL